MGKRDKRKKAAKSTGEKKPAAKSKDADVAKAARKQKKSVLDDDEEDIDAILRAFKAEEESKFQITEEKMVDPPSRRGGAIMLANPLVMNELVMFGGEFFDGQKVEMFNSIYKYNIDKKEFKRITSPNSPSPRSSHQMVVTPTGKIFMFGGEFVSPNQSTFYHYKDFWLYDLVTNQWEKLDVKGTPSARSGHRMVLWKHYIVLFGGFFDTYKETRYYDDLHLFDTTNYTWTRLELMEPKPSARSGHQLFTNAVDVILFGGYCKTVIKGEKAKGHVYNDAWTLKMNLEPKLIRWERRKRPQFMPTPPRSGCSMVCYKNKAFMFGGVSDEESEEKIDSVCHDDLYVYTIDGNRWYPAGIKQSTKKSKSKRKIEERKPELYDDEANPDEVDEQDDDTLLEPPAPQEPTTLPTPSQSPEPIRSSKPSARFSTMLTITQNRLYMYGGICESGDKEYTLNDLWSINLDKLDGWECVISDETAQSAWVGDDEEDDGSSDGSDDEDDDEEGDKSSESENEDTQAVDIHEDIYEKEEIVEPPPVIIEPLKPLTPEELQRRAEEEENDPKPGELINKYWERTTRYWQRIVHEESQTLTGKSLRRDAFEVAKERFDEMQPQLEPLKKQLEEAAEVISQNQKKAVESATERLSTRSRR
ncbi:hypothetical protein SmJEL517_g06078 [Synchytrium microbalum]|uniref:DUF4110 domain-containing protein n=1 Tax=Synchytrium microbalum TaxID=1806994 RepID=A0A507BSL1_9FUNG|nr:uncharacterized protein SmJEL517_g06078 [Synchytrium microbalum]TPX30341.1 hypothetical protein SmJEL517_g06078 [Synchytrium microbalum]